MKKTPLLLLLPMLALAACAGGETTSGSSEPSELDAALAALGGEITITGTSTRSRTFPNPYYSENDNVSVFNDTVSFAADAFSSLSERPADEARDSLTVFKGTDGLAKTEYLAIDNTIGYENYLVDGEAVPFKGNFDNPLAGLAEEDLTAVAGSTGEYELPADLGLDLAHRIFGAGYSGQLVLSVGEEGYGLTGTLKGSEKFVSTGTYTAVDVEVVVDYEITLGATVEDTVAVGTTIGELDSVFEGAEDGFTFSTLMEGEETSRVYFDGENILFTMFGIGGSEPAMMDWYFTPNPEGTMDLYWYFTLDNENFEWLPNDPEIYETYYEKETYDYLAGDLAELSSGIFYEDTDGSYKVKDIALSRIGAIIPMVHDALLLAPYDDFRLNTTAATFAVTGEKSFQIDVTSVYGTGAVSTVTASFAFSNIGQTELPYTPVLPE